MIKKFYDSYYTDKGGEIWDEEDFIPGPRRGGPLSDVPFDEPKKGWKFKIWKSNGFSFLFHYQGGWNEGEEKRLYILWWEINITKIK